MSQRRTTVANRTVLTRLTREIMERKPAVARGLYEIGARLARIRDDELWKVRYDSFDDYVRRAVDISPRSARRFIRIASQFNATIAARYGADKLEAAIRYMQATPVKERPGDLLATDVRLRDDDGRYYTVPLHEASAAQIRAGTALLAELRRSAVRLPRAVRSGLKTMSDTLPEAPPGTTRGERVRVRRGRDGRLAVTIAAVPLDDLDGLIRALRTLRGQLS